jgi:hypothetical protein
MVKKKSKWTSAAIDWIRNQTLEYEKIIKLRKEYNRNIVVTRRKLEKQDEDC